MHRLEARFFITIMIMIMITITSLFISLISI